MRVSSDAKIASLHLQKNHQKSYTSWISIEKYPLIQLSKRARVSLFLILHCTAQQLEFPHFLVPEAVWWPYDPLGVNVLSFY